MIDTSEFEKPVFYDFNKETNEKKVIFTNIKGETIHTVKYRTRKIKQQEQGISENV